MIDSFEKPQDCLANEEADIQNALEPFVFNILQTRIEKTKDQFISTLPEVSEKEARDKIIKNLEELLLEAAKKKFPKIEKTILRKVFRLIETNSDEEVSSLLQDIIDESTFKIVEDLKPYIEIQNEILGLDEFLSGQSESLEDGTIDLLKKRIFFLESYPAAKVPTIQKMHYLQEATKDPDSVYFVVEILLNENPEITFEACLAYIQTYIEISDEIVEAAYVALQKKGLDE